MARSRHARSSTLRKFLERHAPESLARGCAGARPATDHPRRAAHRPRCRLGPRCQGRAARLCARRQHGDHDHAYPGGRRAHGRPHRRHRAWTADRAGHPRRAAPPSRPQRDQPGGHLPGAGRRRGQGGVSAPGTIAWFARHDARLAWRDWVAMMTAGGRWRPRTVAVALIVFVGFMHLLALSMVGRFADLTADADKATLVVVTGVALLSLSLMASQAMESATRAFYARGDLDLILSSPAAAQRVFAVRIATLALAIIAM